MHIVTTDTSAWWVLLVAYDDHEVETATLIRLLESHGIMQIYVGDRGQRMHVAFERHQEAVDLLRATPFAEKLGIHKIIGGPRPEAHLPRTRPGPGETNWENVGMFENADLDPYKVLRLLNEGGCEAGLKTFGTGPEHTSIYVPAVQGETARRVIRSSAFVGKVKIQY